MSEQNPQLPAPEPIVETTSRREWIAPVVHDLPRLTQLTLQTGNIPGEEGVF